MESNNAVNLDYMRIEIATLLEPVKLKNPVKGKFKIPVIMTKDDVTTISTSTRNISNKSPGAARSSSIKSNNYIEIDIPMCFRFFFNDKKKIPKDTKFLVAFIGANVNDAKIIGIYDTEEYEEFVFSYFELQKKFKEVVKRLKALEAIHDIEYDDSDMEGDGE